MLYISFYIESVSVFWAVVMGKDKAVDCGVGVGEIEQA